VRTWAVRAINVKLQWVAASELGSERVSIASQRSRSRGTARVAVECGGRLPRDNAETSTIKSANERRCSRGR
jgi:hypothetical protein